MLWKLMKPCTSTGSRCLDTGESVTLAEMEEFLPPGLNPLSLNIIQRTGEFAADKSTLMDMPEDEVADDDRNGKRKLKRMLKTVKAKTRAAAVATSKGTWILSVARRPRTVLHSLNIDGCVKQ